MQVAERALLIWNNEYFIELVSHHRQTIFPLLIEALEDNAGGHWNSAVHQLTLNVMKLLQDMDENLYEQCRQQLVQRRKLQTQLDQKRIQDWAEIQQMATRNRQLQISADVTWPAGQVA